MTSAAEGSAVPTEKTKAFAKAVRRAEQTVCSRVSSMDCEWAEKRVSRQAASTAAPKVVSRADSRAAEKVVWRAESRAA